MVTVWVAAALIPGIAYETWQALAIASLVLGILNAILRPILMLLSLPLLLLTLGLFLLVINALMLKCTGWIVPGFEVTGFWSALGGAIIISIINLFSGKGRNTTHSQVTARPQRGGNRRSNGPKPPPGKGPVIDI